MTEELLRIDIDGGKYTVVQPQGEQARIDRYGEPWIGPGFAGSNCVLAMAYELELLRESKIATLEEAVDRDFGIECNREITELGVMRTRPAPGVPELSTGTMGRLRWWASQLATMAAAMKVEAAELNSAGLQDDACMLIRIQLSTEETGELAAAIADRDLPHVLQELVDLSYVTDGTYLTLGCGDYKLSGYREVHDANLSKVWPDGRARVDASGRWMKGPNTRKPDMEKVLAAASPNGP